VTARILFAGLSLAVVLAAFAAGRASASRGAPLVIPAAVVVIPVTAGDGEPDLEGFRRPPSTLPASSPAVASTPRPGPRHHSITGTASWFATGPDCLCAAAGPALRAFLGPEWRGTRVRVCAVAACVSVVINDFCRCPTAMVDLSDEAFRLLAPLSVGVLRVRVSA
jgi:hypothetical protein